MECQRWPSIFIFFCWTCILFFKQTFHKFFFRRLFFCYMRCRKWWSRGCSYSNRMDHAYYSKTVQVSMGLACRKSYFDRLLLLLGSSFIDAFSSSQFSISSLNDLARIGLFFISFLGSMFSFENQTIIFTSGVIIVCHFIFLIYKKYYVINLTVFCFMIYIILLAATAAMYRSGMGENAVLADRYKIHSLIMVLMIYISLVDLFYSRINRKWVFVTSMVLMTGSMYFISYSEGKQKLEYSKYFLVWRTNQWLDQNYNLPAQPYQSQANAIMTRALTSGYLQATASTT